MGEGESDEEKAAKNKGVVADNVAQSAEWRIKSGRMGYIQTVIYAFCDAYYDSPVESFGDLLSEAIEIIQAYASEESSKDAEPDKKALE